MNQPDFYTQNWIRIERDKNLKKLVLDELLKLKNLYRELNSYNIFSNELESLLIEHLERLIILKPIEE